MSVGIELLLKKIIKTDYHRTRHVSLKLIFEQHFLPYQAFVRVGDDIFGLYSHDLI